MGSYIYTYKKKLDKKVIFDGQEVTVIEQDQPKYITFGEEVYKNNKRGIWSDASGFWTGIDYKKDYVGKLEKVGRKYFIKYLID